MFTLVGLVILEGLVSMPACLEGMVSLFGHVKTSVLSSASLDGFLVLVNRVPVTATGYLKSIDLHLHLIKSTAYVAPFKWVVLKKE